MASLVYFKENFFPRILKSYSKCAIDEKASNDEIVTLRLPLVNEDEAESFKIYLSDIMRSQWVVKYSKPLLQK